MKHLFRRILSLSLALSLAAALALPAAASNALGEDLISQETVLNEETELATNVFWSSAYSDLRTENVITYSPNKDVTPIVTFGDVLTQRRTVSAAAQQLEAEGYRVVAGINGDFYNTGNGLPIGIVVTEGQLRSSDAGYYAIGFREDGSAILGKPGVQISADLGYGVDNGMGEQTSIVRSIAGVNKARVTSGGIYLYTYDFNDRHTTGTTESGVDVVCTIVDGSLAIGQTLTARVESVTEGSTAASVGRDQIVLSANLQANTYYVDALRNIPQGSEITVTLTASQQGWEDVEYAVGALYSLVENGQVVSGLAAGANPRTAIGQKADGTLVFYTIDGRRSGYSIGATLTQVAQRMVELGCETALCLDGGGSTTLSVTSPDSTEAAVINRPSDGSARAVTNQVFLVASATPSERLKSFYVQPEANLVLAGSTVRIEATGVDTNYIPMEHSYELDADGGTLQDNVLTTPRREGEVTITASGGGKRGSATIYVVERPDALSIKSGSTAVTELTVTPGSRTELSASATYRHLPLKVDASAVEWSFDGSCATVDENGILKAVAPGSGTLAASAGGLSVQVKVNVNRVALETVEDFEKAHTIFDGFGGSGATFTTTQDGNFVRMGKASGKIDYVLTEGLDYAAEWHASSGTSISNSLYTSLNLWVYGDGSGNTLQMLYSNGAGESLGADVAVLDFTGWKQVSIPTAGDAFVIQGWRVAAPRTILADDGVNVEWSQPTTALSGTVYVDQIVASFLGTVDQTPPSVSAALDSASDTVTAAVSDAVDGVLPASAVTVFYNGKDVTEHASYSATSGKVTFALPSVGEAREAIRITVIAKDASGNIGRASVDVPPVGVSHKFTDIDGYWAADYVDFLYNAGITTGYTDGTFRPNENISRAQFAVMLYRYLGLKESDYADVKLPFADVSQIGDYAVAAVKALYAQGIISGTVGSNGKLYFNPNAPLTRAQAAAMIGRTQEKGYATQALTFSDAAAIPAYAVPYIQTMTAQGVISGYTDGTFKPGSNITRGQMAKILYTLM